MLSDVILTKIKSQKGNVSKDNILDIITDVFYNEIITKSDRLLLDFAFSKSLTQENLDLFLSEWDIEKAGSHKSLIVSYIAKMNGHLKFTPYEFPRLEGLLKFYRFKNLNLIAHYTKLGKAWNKEGIKPLVFKGGAMKFLRPDLPRTMGDIDVIVPNDSFMESAKIAKSIGYEYFQLAEDVDRVFCLQEIGKDADTLDVHSFFYIDSGKGKSYTQKLFSRASEVKVFGVDSFLPCHEDMLFILLINLAKNIRTFSSINGIIYNAFDCHYLVSANSNFDWSIVLENAKQTKSIVEVYLAMKFINKIMPNLLPVEKFTIHECNKEIEKYYFILRYYYEYIPKLLEKSNLYPKSTRNTNLSSFLKFWFIKPWYVIPNRLRNNYLFIKTYYTIKYMCTGVK